MQFRVVGVIRVREVPATYPCEGEGDRVYISRQANLVDCLNHVMGELVSNLDEETLTGESRKYVEMNILLEAVRYTTLNQQNILDTVPIESDGLYKEGL